MLKTMPEAELAQLRPEYERANWMNCEQSLRTSAQLGAFRLRADHRAAVLT
jgi:hypothetical protein